MSESTKIKLEIGDIAPDFVAKIETGEKIHLYDILKSGKKVLLVFYPADFTPGCTAQLCGIRDIYSQYSDFGVTILGVNPGDADSHKKFIDHHKYQFSIAVDEDRQIIEKYGAKGFLYGRPRIMRGVFLIGSDKKIIYRFWGQQDNQKILNILKEL
jgi:thioredoxin-dependent peroxiredoxin